MLIGKLSKLQPLKNGAITVTITCPIESLQDIVYLFNKDVLIQSAAESNSVDRKKILEQMKEAICQMADSINKELNNDTY